MHTLENHTDGPLSADDGMQVNAVDFACDTSNAPTDEATFPGRPMTRGLLDLQVNGFAGVDFNDEDLTAEALDHALAAMLATGVTHCLPTIITATRDTLAKRLGALDAAVKASTLGPLMVPGYHLEGPFLNPSPGYAGCHPPQAMIPASWEMVAALELGLTRPILLVTVAPEMQGGLDFVAQAHRAGKLVAIGHSAADADMVKRAADAGARMSTHLGNGLPQILPKLNNTLFAQLSEERLSAGFIADGVHIPLNVLRVLMRARGLDRAILVTDAVSAAASAPGTYSMAGMQLVLGTDGAVREPGHENLAGAALCLDQAMRNVVDEGICTPREALRMACHNPTELLGPALRHHGMQLEPSAVEWTPDLQVSRVWIGHLCCTR